MGTDRLDHIDFGILHLLQENARNLTPVDMADQLPVSSQTVRNRIEKMEERGVIEGYVPVINYGKAGFPIRLQFSCTAPVPERQKLAERALEVDHVVNVQEMLTAQENVRPLAVTQETEGLNDISTKLDELGLTIERERLLRYEHRRPFNHFGEPVVSDE